MANPAAVYAKAIFELARQKQAGGVCAKDLSSFWELCLAHKALYAALCGAGTNAATRQAILSEVIGALSLHELSQRFLLLLAARGRLAALPEILAELESLANRDEGICAGELYSAVELSSEEVGVLASALEKRVGARVKLEQKIDPTLLGGFVASVGGKTYDASLKNQLERFKGELI